MRKMLIALCGVALLGWGHVEPANAKPTDEEVQDAADKLVLFLSRQIQGEQSALALFSAADRNGNGEITFAEFKKILKSYGLQIKSAVLKEVFVALDDQFGNGDKKLSEDEYLDIVVALNL